MRIKNSPQEITKAKFENEKGMSLVTSLLILTLLLGFVALALSRTVSETLMTENDASESRTFGAAESGLESATRDFATVMESKTAPSQNDLETIENADVPGFSDKYTFVKTIRQLSASQPVTLSSGQYQGLYSLRDEWQTDITAKEKISGTEVQLRRRFYNNLIPIFQFGAFYNDDFELYTPPLFVFKGRVHSNGNIFLTSNTEGIYFKSKLTAVGELVTDGRKSGAPLTSSETSGNLFVQNASGADKQITNSNGSVTCTSQTGNSILVDPTGRNFPYKDCQKNPNWDSFVQQFDGNLQIGLKKLTMPLDRLNVNLIEMIRRGKNIGDKANIGGSITDVLPVNEDSKILSKERFANKNGIRISLSDSQDKLPQCGNAAGTNCGVKLDGALGASLGYQPLAMTDGYQATALNANRLYYPNREVWIKVELVNYDSDNNTVVTKDITQDILSLGVTEPAPLSGNLQIAGYDSNTDTRSIIKLQRFFMKGDAIPAPTATTYNTNAAINSQSYSFVARYNVPSSFTADISKSLFLQCKGMVETSATLLDSLPYCTGKDAYSSPQVNEKIIYSNEGQHFKLATVNGSKYFIVPFPIELFDTREGNRTDSNSLSSGYLYRNGAMSLIDIDVANLRRFLNGEFNDKFPTTTPFAKSNNGKGLKNTDVPEARGWVVYVSDRRGDYNFDGKYNMEDIDPNGTLLNEDLDNNGAIDTDYVYEAPPQNSIYESGYAAVTDHPHYRRGVRLINGMTLPGKYDSITPGNTQGFTFASENGIYVLGNYNVQSVALPGGNDVADSTAYLPQNTANHIPASIIGDAVTVLSNSWYDGNSFAYPLDMTKRVASNTQVRFAMIAGDSITPRDTIDNQDYTGGLHNFKRFLESWSNKRLNYTGSLVNLYNASNNNGRFKCCTTVYKPPIRDWTFDSTFTDPDRLPPGTPYAYNLAFTGFQRVNE